MECFFSIFFLFSRGNLSTSFVERTFFFRQQRFLRAVQLKWPITKIVNAVAICWCALIIKKSCRFRGILCWWLKFSTIAGTHYAWHVGFSIGFLGTIVGLYQALLNKYERVSCRTAVTSSCTPWMVMMNCWKKKQFFFVHYCAILVLDTFNPTLFHFDSLFSL